MNNIGTTAQKKWLAFGYLLAFLSTLHFFSDGEATGVS